MPPREDRKSTRLNSSHMSISYAVFCLKKKNRNRNGGKTQHRSLHHAGIMKMKPYAQKKSMLLYFGNPVRELFFFLNDSATTEIYTLSLHDALPICRERTYRLRLRVSCASARYPRLRIARDRSEEHTSELQSHVNLVCRLLL